jgi:hypothetical protein
MKMRRFGAIASGIVLSLLIGLGGGLASAQIIPSGEYSLTSITGSYAWGQTDWNDATCLGYVDNVADLATVETLLSDGYTAQSANSPCGANPIANGIYNWDPAGFHALEFDMVGGANYTLNQLNFMSSRSYSGTTPITVDYAVDGGPWTTAVATTSGTIGITTGAANTYSLSLGGVVADRFRFTTTDGDQVSLHEISIEGVAELAITSIPTLSEVGIWVFALLLAVSALMAIRLRFGS